MKKYLFTLFIDLCGIFNCQAQNNLVECVIVELQNGETLSLALKYTPKVQFESEQVLITAGDFEATYERSLLHRFYFKMDIDGIHAIADAEKKSAGSIYDTHGRKVADYEGSIDTINLQKGVYVVKTKSGESFKMLKK